MFRPNFMQSIILCFLTKHVTLQLDMLFDCTFIIIIILVKLYIVYGLQMDMLIIPFRICIFVIIIILLMVHVYHTYIEQSV